MTTEIRKVIIQEKAWDYGGVDDYVITLRNKCCERAELIQLGINIQGLESISDGEKETVIRAIAYSDICIDGIFRRQKRVGTYRIKDDTEVIVYRTGLIKSAVDGIEVRRVK